MDALLKAAVLVIVVAVAFYFIRFLLVVLEGFDYNKGVMLEIQNEPHRPTQYNLDQAKRERALVLQERAVMTGSA
jgi:hypothetical protein